MIKIIKPVLIFVIFSFYAGVVSAQLQFVENKGQWDKKIAFKGDLNFGSFVLKQDGGFRVVLYHPDDLLAITGDFHGGLKKPSVKNQKTLATGKDSSIKKLRGHAYEVNFINANPNPQVVMDKPMGAISNYIIGNDSSTCSISRSY